MALDKKYKIIYAAPPWEYSDVMTWKIMAGGVSHHYKTMDIEAIKALPIANIADDDCILFLWATFPNLQWGLDVIKAWGFKYKTLGFSWIKLNKKDGKPWFGIGHYTKSNCEVCLIGVKGKSLKASDKVSSVVMTPREGHSKKPDIIRDKIVELCGDLPRIELFARDRGDKDLFGGNRMDGWDTWGNEVKNSISI